MGFPSLFGASRIALTLGADYDKVKLVILHKLPHNEVNILKEKPNKSKISKKTKFGAIVFAASAISGIAATILALTKKKKREEVYHEAELKAMNELDDLMAECGSDDCADCSCAEECAAADTSAQDETEPEEEAAEEPINDVETDETNETEKPEA